MEGMLKYKKWGLRGNISGVPSHLIQQCIGSLVYLFRG